MRVATKDDVEAVAALEHEVWGDGAASAATLAQRFENCPEGNIIAVVPDGRICGYTAFCYLDYSEYESAGKCTWYDLSGDGTAATNVFGAPDLFGINLGCTHWAPKGASQSLLMEVVKSGVRRRARRGVLGARLPGYHRYAQKMTAEEYAAAERKPGVVLDPELRYYYAFGMRPTRLVENYFVDPDSKDWGMIVEMALPWWMRVAGPTLLRLPLDWNTLIEKYL
jgi:hypothetical protein